MLWFGEWWSRLLARSCSTTYRGKGGTEGGTEER